uniref:N2227 domain-containing protein n=1 Tax=Anopheles funestus TaxID=62324 RepID=A0A4Y0BFT7_ANOFN
MDASSASNNTKEALKEDSEISVSEDMEEERKNFFKIIAAFKYYRHSSIAELKRKETFLQTLPPAHQKMLSNYQEHLQNLKRCIDVNAQVIKQIIQDANCLFQNADHNIEPDLQPSDGMKLRYQDFQKVQITMKQIFRDWSEQGKLERDQCYTPIIDEITKFFTSTENIYFDRKHQLWSQTSSFYQL